MKIATTTGDFCDYEKEYDISAILPLMKESGFKHVDVNLSGAFKPDSPLCGDGWKSWAYDIKNTGERLGMDFVQAHSSDTVYDRGEKRGYLTSMIERELEVCEILGVPGVVVHGICKKDGGREEFMEKNTELYRELLKTAEKTGVAIYTENTCHKNAPSYHLFEGEDMNELVERVDHPLFGAVWDIGHAHVEGVDQYKAIMTMGRNLRALHVHDNFGVADVHIQPYAGNLCYDAILNGLVDSGYKGCFTLEAFSMPSPQTFCFCNRKSFEKDGRVYNRLGMPPVSIKIRSERLMHDVAQFMLEAYDCYEE